MKNKALIVFCGFMLLVVSNLKAQDTAAVSNSSVSQETTTQPSANSGETTQFSTNSQEVNQPAAAQPSANSQSASEVNTQTTSQPTTSSPDTKATPSTASQNAVNPKEALKEQTISRIRNLSLAGHYSSAEALLNDYKKEYGEDKAYTIEQARLWALTNQSTKAISAVDPLLQQDPKNQTLIDIKNYAVAHPEPKITAAPAAVAVPAAPVKPQDTAKAATIKKIQTELINGKYAQALKDINQNTAKYGKDKDFQTEKARYYALTNQPQSAIAILDPLLKADPNNKNLQDIKQYALSHPAQPKVVVVPQPTPMDIANNLAAQADKNGHDPALYAQAADAYIAAQDSKNALVMINKAVSLKPTDYDYRYKQAQIAMLAGDYKTSYESFKFIYPKVHDARAILGYARAASYYNKLDRSSKLYARYLKLNPNDPKPWLEAAYVENFRGNFRRAINLLDEYKKRFGQSKEYLIERARILATANRPTEALMLTNHLLPYNPDNYDLNYADTVALYYANDPIKMFDSLARVNALDPTSAQTQGLNDFIRTPYRSNIGGDVYHSRDTDTVDITRGTLDGQYFLSPTTSIIGSASTEELSADEDSGLNPIEGGESLNLSNYNLGMTHRFNQNIAVSGVAGASHVTDGQDAFTYEADVYTWLNEFFQVNLLNKENYYDVSARAVSLGVKQNLTQANFLIQPCVQCYVNINTSYSSFSDSNSMEFVSANLMRTFLANQYFNLNLGVTGQWDSFAEDLNDGYYDPSDYKYYAGVMDLYIKQSDNVGYSIYVALGRQKDETFTNFTTADDFGGKAYFGIYKNWFLVLSGGYSNRIRAVAENPTLGPYHVYGFDVALTRRFG